MVVEVGSDPILSLDFYIICIVVVTAAALLFCYFVALPDYDPRSPKPSFLSFVFFAWLFPKIRGPDNPTTVHDYPDATGTESFNPDVFVDAFTKHWQSSGGAGLDAAVMSVLTPCLVIQHVMRAGPSFFPFLDAYCISCLISFMNNDHGTSAGVRITALILLKSASGGLLTFLGFFTYGFGVFPATVPLKVLILRKLRRLGPKGMAQTSSASVQQLLQDVVALENTLFESQLPSAGLHVICVLVSVFQLHGLFGTMSITTGVATASLLMYLQSYCEKIIQDLSDATRDANESRLENLKEICDTHEVLKLYDWARKFTEPLGDAATSIMNISLTSARWNALCNFLGSCVSDGFIVIALLISTLVLGQEIVFDEFFQAQVYVAILQGSTKGLYSCYANKAKISTKTKKIEQFLRLPERSPPVEGPLAAENATFAWLKVKSYSEGEEQDKEQTKEQDFEELQVLSDIQIRIGAQELVLVSGPVRSGKTSLLLSLLGESQRTAGTAQLPGGAVAFQPQVPYLMDGTIRENVLFGVDSGQEDEADLQVALMAAQIAVDMDDEKSTLHELREFSRVGNQGSGISGGQRARVALARMVHAVLKGAEVVMLDDPLCALDNAMVSAVWGSAVVTAMSTATRVVVVNSQLLWRLGPDADRIILLEEGRIVYNGPPSELAANTKLSDRFGEGYAISRVPSLAKTGHGKIHHLRSVAYGVMKTRSLKRDAVHQFVVASTPQSDPTKPQSDPTKAFADFLCSSAGVQQFLSETLSSESPLKLQESEWQEFRQLASRWLKAQAPSTTAEQSGATHCSTVSVVVSFFKRMLFWTLSAMLLSFAAQAMPRWSNMVLKDWAEGKLGYSNSTSALIFTALSLGNHLLETASGYVKAHGTALMSRALRCSVDQTLVSLAKPYFWRGGTSADVRTVVLTDPGEFGILSELPVVLAGCLFGLLAVLKTMPVLLPLVLLGAVWQHYTSFPTTWALSQLLPLYIGVLQQPLSIVAEEYDSCVTIRALHVEAHFDGAAQRAIMKQAYIFFDILASLGLGTLFAVPVEMAFTVCALVVVMSLKMSGGSGDTAQALFLFNLIRSLNRQVGAVKVIWDLAAPKVALYNKVDTFLHTKYIEDESGMDAPEDWPSKGAIAFDRVAFRYIPNGPLALQYATVHVVAGEKVGIVGPTGGGKSTFVKLIFRLGPLKGVPPSSGGTVTIDGVDIAGLKLSVLRRAIGVVPQEPTLFRGTLRDNLCGDGDATDAEMIAALSACGLGDLATPAAVSQALSPDMSQGEKQFVAAARVLVRRPKIIILDEATAYLGQKSSDRLMDVIVEHCAGATVISIAHRLRFVLGCDRILCLQRGGTVESFAAPAELQRDETSYFSRQLRLEQQED